MRVLCIAFRFNSSFIKIKQICEQTLNNLGETLLNLLLLFLLLLYNNNNNNNNNSQTKSL